MYSFPKTKRLLKRSEFQKAYSKGIKLFGSILFLYASASLSPTCRLGISVPKRYGKSHDRNLFKRIIREGFRHHLFPIGRSYDLNVVAKMAIKEIPPETLRKELQDLLEKVNQID